MDDLRIHLSRMLLTSFALAAMGCFSPEPEGIGTPSTAPTTVKMDFYHRPLPEIPLPNDVATRYDATSATGRRINASLIAPTYFEQRARARIDMLDGWGVFMPISIPFTGPLDVQSIIDGHRDENYDLENDVVYLVNVDPDSPDFGEFMHLDIGNGNYPHVLEKRDLYWPNDPRGDSISLFFEETDEDLNGNGKLDPGEDTDADGLLDKPNYLPGAAPEADDLAGRADALMTFYEKETNTLLIRPMMPLNERTTYAVVITKRLKDADGIPVGSPYKFTNHASQTTALKPLPGILSDVGVTKADIAFAFTFTTQTIGSAWKAVRDGLYGHGVQSHIAEEFPAEVAGVETVRDRTFPNFKNIKNVHVVYQEDWNDSLKLVLEALLGRNPNSLEFQRIMEAYQYVDYHVVGWFDSPQLFPRENGDGTPVPFTDQAWPEDLDRVKAPLRSERVYFHLMVPRKETSVRGQGLPAPVQILGHGYSSNRFDIATIGPYAAKQGLAVIAIDCVSHGIGLSPDEAQQAEDIHALVGLRPYLEAVTRRDRAYDHNNDQVADSGADFWTAYLFHTRDVVRQSALDYMQLVRVLRGFDGTRRFGFDVNGDGKNDLAGDFDGDGVVDIGGDASIGMMGASLGGIMSSVVSALEPEIAASIPIAAGGGLSDVGLRSYQGGVPQAVILRVMGPLFIGTQSANEDSMRIETIIPNGNSDSRLQIAAATDVQAGDFIVIENLANGSRGCGYVRDVNGELQFRVSVESSLADQLRLVIYDGDAMVLGSTECAIADDATERQSIETFEFDTNFQNRLYARDTPLQALAEGMGLKRNTPRLRRFLALGQLVLDGADPAVYAPLLKSKPMTYPGTGQTTGGHTLIVTTAGDMNVPASTGVNIARAAGIVNYLDNDPRYGKPANQVLIDTYTAEAVDTLGRFTDSNGTGVIMDVENFSNGMDLWGDEIERLDPPLRLGMDAKVDGGYSAAIFPFPEPAGQHGFAFPGVFIDMKRKECNDACETDSCDCESIDGSNMFDIGSYLFNMFARYLATDGQDLTTDTCLSSDDCPFIETVPEPREPGLN